MRWFANTPAQIATGRRLLARLGSWDAIRASSLLVNGVWIVRPDNMGKLHAKAKLAERGHKRTCACQGVAFGSYEAQVELVPPPFLSREDGRGICVDVCLALEVADLWRQGVRTTGCCCGHGKLEPTICVAEESIEAMRAAGYKNTPLLPGRDDAFTAKTGWPILKAHPGNGGTGSEGVG